MTHWETIGFFDFDTGRRYGVEHFRWDSDGDHWEHIESRAEDFAGYTGRTIDIRTSIKDETGAIVGWDRAGIRVMAA